MLSQAQHNYWFLLEKCQTESNPKLKKDQPEPRITGSVLPWAVGSGRDLKDPCNYKQQATLFNVLQGLDN